MKKLDELAKLGAVVLEDWGERLTTDRIDQLVAEIRKQEPPKLQHSLQETTTDSRYKEVM